MNRALLCFAMAALMLTTAALGKDSPPNLIVILADDLGWGDLGCYGAKEIRTPNIDRLAREGTRFTDFYAAAPFCSPSRAALLTGRYPTRCGVPYVLFPTEHHGLPPGELTLAEHLKAAGYTTACISKWHLGWDKPFRPTRRGFDLFFGLPYSNDGREWPVGEAFTQVMGLQPLPLIDGERVVEAPVDQAQLTSRYTKRAIEFIRANRDTPFFLYFAHTMPHIPQHVSQPFSGKSTVGIYGDAIEEIDHSVGRILGSLHELKLDGKTVVLFTSDNGAVIRPPNWKTGQGPFAGRDFGGSNGPLRGAKGQTFEGGMRVPGVWWGPGRIKAGQVISTPASLLDVFPTCASFANVKLPQNRVFDGRNLSPLLSGAERGSAPPFFYYFGPQLQAVREGPWKLFLAISNYPADAPQSLWYMHQPSIFERHHRLWPKPSLYQLENDPGETTDVAAQHPDVVGRLSKVAQEFDFRLSPQKRPLFKVEGPVPPSPGQIRTSDVNLSAGRDVP